MEKNKIDDIYNMLDALASGEDPKPRRKSRQKSLADINDNIIEAKTVKKPKLPNNIGECSGRYDCFEKLIRNVDYGIENSPNYVAGHKDALNKFLRQASANQKNLTLVEARVNEEMKKESIKSKNDVYDKGYYDGLLYVYRALRKSKEDLSKKIYNILKKELY